MAMDRNLHNWCTPIESLRKQAQHLHFETIDMEEGRVFQVTSDGNPVYLVTVFKHVVEEDLEKPVPLQKTRVTYHIRFITDNIRILTGKLAMCREILESTQLPRLYVGRMGISVTQKTFSFEIGINEKQDTPVEDPPVKWACSDRKDHVDMVYKLLRVILDLHLDGLTAPEYPCFKFKISKARATIDKDSDQDLSFFEFAESLPPLLDLAESMPP